MTNTSPKTKREISWPKVLILLQTHFTALFGIAVLWQASWLTILFSALLIMLSVLGVTAGAHRLWAHHSYEANTGVRVFLMLCHTLAGQGTIHDWVIRHRAHHKHIDTENDPCHVHRGFISAHIIANIEQPNKRDLEVYKEVDTQDLENDAVVVFQRKFYWLLMPIICILLPVNAPMEYWGDSFMISILVAGVLRYAITAQMAHLLYSAQHIWGLKPGDKYPADTMLVFILTKSHWIRYHYLLSWDYQVGEFGGYGDGFITSIIRTFASFGWATNLRSVSSDIIKDAVYASTISGKPVDQCVQEIENAKPKVRTTLEGRYHTAKFL